MGDIRRHTQSDTSGRGLTDFGRDLVSELNDLGVMIDVAHLSYASIAETVHTSRVPVLASHTGALALNHEQTVCLPDEIMQAVAEAGGVVGIHFMSQIVKPGRHRATFAELLAQFEYVAKLIGPQHVALSPDYSYLDPRMWENAGITIPYARRPRAPGCTSSAPPTQPTTTSMPRAATSTASRSRSTTARPRPASCACARLGRRRPGLDLCTVSVTDTSGSGTPSVPAGSVAFTSDSDGSFSAPSCVLSGGSCSVTYTAATVDGGIHNIDAAYTHSGDIHSDSVDADGFDITVTARSTATVVTCASPVVVDGRARPARSP